AGRAFELWLYADRTPRPLGILPEAGRTVIPLAPRDAARLAGSGALWATREPREGAPDLRPSGPPAFRGRFPRVVN
ncbi:MAG TPA: hypothetical protein VJ770_07360, partial [Stellaceae bacterium]|nr:hypothetical protein [Stellaceae bacterium]